MNRKEAQEIIQSVCKTKKQKEAFALLFATEEHCKYKCGYYHEICRHCLNWPSPDDVANDDADDGCKIYEMAAYLHNQNEVAETGRCKYFMEF